MNMKNAHELLKEYYLADNYEIVDFGDNHKGLCYVFFSSNGLYDNRNNIESIKTMFNTKRYEWKFLSSNKKIIKKASKLIYLRDIYKAFYIYGLNRHMDSIDQIVSFLNEETKGMRVVLAGSSAGAYMALLVGHMLPSTYRVISLGGVIDLEGWRNFSDYLSKNLDNSKYKNIKDFLQGDYWIINFYGKRNKLDCDNASLLTQMANDDKLINIGFDVDEHAPRPSGDDLIKLLTCNDSHLKKLKFKNDQRCILNSFQFSLINIGVCKSYYNLFKKRLVILSRRTNEKNN